MRAGLVSYFDIGFSIGLTDDVLSSDHRNAPVNIGLVGIQNPLGQGVTVDLRDGAFIRLWRDETIAQVRREDMETGWKEEWTDLPRATFNQRLIDIIDQHPVTVCKLTLHSLGIVYFRFELGAAVPPRFAQAHRAYHSPRSWTSERRHRLRGVESILRVHTPLTVDRPGRRPTTRRDAGITWNGAGSYNRIRVSRQNSLWLVDLPLDSAPTCAVDSRAGTCSNNGVHSHRTHLGRNLRGFPEAVSRRD